jgi:hypothetical protein
MNNDFSKEQLKFNPPENGKESQPTFRDIFLKPSNYGRILDICPNNKYLLTLQ